jgi:outer membrane translocation and assembly module TamA
LLRVGGAVFADVGRAWGGDNINRVNPGWLGNVGVGLRLFNVRSAFISVIHLDVAVPINPDPGMSRVQFLIHTRASF